MTNEEWAKRVIEKMCEYGGQLDLEKKLAVIFGEALAAQREKDAKIVEDTPHGAVGHAGRAFLAAMIRKA